MPLIRYSKGDTLEIVPSKSPNVINPIIIKVIKGRILDAIELPNGIEINPYCLLEVISEVNNHTKDTIVDFRFIYHKCSNILECDLAINKAAWRESICTIFESVLKRKLGSNIFVRTQIFRDANRERNISKRQLIEIQEN